MTAWFKAHVKQLALVGLWAVGMGVLHYHPELRGQLTDGASTLFLLFGIQVAPFTLKGGAQAVAKVVGTAMLLAVALVLTACTARTVAKDAYYAEQEACLQSYSTQAEQKACVAGVRSAWSEAGAPPAAVATVAVPFDAGADGKVMVSQ